MKCSVDGCDSKAHAKGLCPKHYHRVRTSGSFELQSLFRDSVVACFPGTISTITAKAGICQTTTEKWIKKLRKEGRSHIGRWDFNGRCHVAVHFDGPGKDVTRPARKSRAVTDAKYRKANKEKTETYNARRVARYHADKKAKATKEQPVTWLSALM